MRIAPTLQAAQIQATLARAETGAGAARIRIYATARPAQPGAHGDTPMCEIELPKPCGAIAGGALVIAPGAIGMVLQPGIPRWAEWLATDGAVLMDASVTDADHGGDFTVAGAATAPGETSPHFMAGALLVLGAVTLT